MPGWMGKGICTMVYGVKYKCTTRLKICKILMLILPSMSCILITIHSGILWPYVVCVHVCVYFSFPYINNQVKSIRS